MVDRYWRKIESVENDIENSMQISSILLKLKAYDGKLGDLSKIGNNENDISLNLGKITTNEGAISSNLGKITTNEGAISSNLGKITTNEGAISSNSGKITTNEGAISSNLGKISINETNISSNLEKIDNIKEFLISPEDFKKTFNIEKQIFRFNRTTHFYTIFEKEITYDFTKNSLLFIYNNIHYKYENLLNDYHRLQHEYNIYDDENNLIYRCLFNKDTYYDENQTPILLTIDDFCIYFKEIYKKIKVNLLLHRHNRHGKGNISLEIDDDSYININYVDKNNEDIEKNKNNISTNLEKIDENKNDISTNLIKINSNEDDILYNLSEINHIKNNNSTQYLKNIYNILFYNKKTQIDFRNIFYEKVFDVNASINDFIEIVFKFELEYQDNDDRNYVKSIYEIFDENNNRLYIRSITNNNYLYFSNKLIIDKNIFIILLQMLKKLNL